MTFFCDSEGIFGKVDFTRLKRTEQELLNRHILFAYNLAIEKAQRLKPRESQRLTALAFTWFFNFMHASFRHFKGQKKTPLFLCYLLRILFTVSLSDRHRN